MPMLLATKQVDGYIAWQPFVSIASKSGIGKVVALSGHRHLTSVMSTTRAVSSLPVMISSHRTLIW